jgi:hypothetical protein
LTDREISSDPLANEARGNFQSGSGDLFVGRVGERAAGARRSVRCAATVDCTAAPSTGLDFTAGVTRGAREPTRTIVVSPARAAAPGSHGARIRAATHSTDCDPAA